VKGTDYGVSQYVFFSVILLDSDILRGTVL